MVTRDDQLKWLAENSGSFSGEYAVMSMHHIGRAIEQGDTLPPKPPFGVYFFTRQEWMNEKDLMQKIATIDNSWHERGELPPVGCKCEWIDESGVDGPAGSLYPCVGDVVSVCAHKQTPGGDIIAIFTWARGDGLGVAASRMPADFRPLRTDREKAIDSLIGIICAGGYLTSRDGAAKAIAERIYDAGYRKQQDGDK